MRVLVSVIHKNALGLFNSVWATIRQLDYLPERIHLFSREVGADAHTSLKRMLEILLEEHGVAVDEGTVQMHYVDGSLRDLFIDVRTILDTEAGEGNSISLDATPGRKDEMIVATLTGLSKDRFEHIFYTSLDTFENTDGPMMLIPISLYHPSDVLREVAE